MPGADDGGRDLGGALTAPPPARFVTGSILRHILVMTGTGAFGLMAIFVGDLANMLFLGQLGDTDILAAVGYASSILFFSISIGIGIGIGATAVIAPAIGAGARTDARRLSTSALVLAALVCFGLAVVVWPLLGPLLGWIGASGRTQMLAVDYLRIIYPSFPLLAVGMTASAVLRSVGDARRSMYVTLSGAIINVVLDARFILVLQMGIRGAAWASVLARLVMALVGLWGVFRAHRLLQRPALADLRRDTGKIMAVAIPAVLTNLATPAANVFVTAAMARYGDAAVAAWAVYGRVNPVAFGAIFALSGSVAPIVGQNFGAGNFARVRETIAVAARVTVVFTVVAWIGLAVSPGLIIRGFGLTGETTGLVYLFCRWLPPLFAFLGFLFIANAVFNTLRHPHYATAFNWGRATMGTVPFVWIGGQWAGAPGVFTGSIAGAVVFGAGALWVCLQLIDRLGEDHQRDPHVS